jgi:hypothetical protein
MADKTEDKGDKTEDKGDKTEDKGQIGGLLSPANGQSGGGWVVVSFVGPAGLDVRRLAAAILFGSRRGAMPALGNAAADALKKVRQRDADNRRLERVAKKNAAAQPKGPAPRALVPKGLLPPKRSTPRRYRAKA